MIGYALAVFLSAFLLFQVQPLIGKYILPWFGGTPAVWTTCMLLFQLLLLLGYAYAHLVAMRLGARRQTLLHIALLAGSLMLLPIVPNEAWRPVDESAPTLRILALLACTIGGPYFLLSSTGPLLQHWFAGAWPGRSPYRLYALSNLGSLLALVTYPFVVEPQFTLDIQAKVWSVAYVAFALLCSACAWWLYRNAERADVAWQAAAVVDATSQSSQNPLPVWYWFWLSATGSVMLLATTNQLCQEVTVVPFLWILPLAIYLLTFVLTFESSRWYRRTFWGPALALSLGAVCYVLEAGPEATLWFQVPAYTAMLFAGCMTCHGELVASRPATQKLTLFYLVIAAGGAAGGLLVAIGAPAIFKGYWEYHLALIGCALAAIVGYGRDRRSPLYGGRPLIAWTAIYCGFVVLSVYLGKHVWYSDQGTLESVRNFYGVLRVRDYGDPLRRTVRALVHGRIMHGQEFLSEPLIGKPVSYYGPPSGVGLAIMHHPRRASANEHDPFRIGVVGLGAGTLAAYGQAGEQMKFYEINPAVERLARKYFTYLDESSAKIEIALGDARTQMQRELQADRAPRFDVLAIDAFSSDAIPMHLITREAFALYRAHLKHDGLLAMHVSSHHIDLNPVVLGLANELGLHAVSIVHNAPENDPAGQSRSEWLIVTANEQFLGEPDVVAAITPWPADIKPIIWTDDFGSLWQVLGKKRDDPSAN
ncbi:MAG TPA: fused MFS/spermidine synthase [Pirellulales bacterium]|nr:fused MFS/spermidine synthase [Pirellulales bacterium]